MHAFHTVEVLITGSVPVRRLRTSCQSLGFQNLDGDITIESRIARRVDLAHSSQPEVYRMATQIQPALNLPRDSEREFV